MARPKRPPHPMLKVAREHLRVIDPALEAAPLRLRLLDGPPGSPRYAVSTARCRRRGPCPYGVADETRCTVRDCPLRDAVRLLLSQDGEVLELICDNLRWDS